MSYNIYFNKNSDQKFGIDYFSNQKLHNDAPYLALKSFWCHSVKWDAKYKTVIIDVLGNEVDFKWSIGRVQILEFERNSANRNIKVKLYCNFDDSDIGFEIENSLISTTDKKYNFNDYYVYDLELLGCYFFTLNKILDNKLNFSFITTFNLEEFIFVSLKPERVIEWINRTDFIFVLGKKEYSNSLEIVNLKLNISSKDFYFLYLIELFLDKKADIRFKSKLNFDSLYNTLLTKSEHVFELSSLGDRARKKYNLEYNFKLGRYEILEFKKENYYTFKEDLKCFILSNYDSTTHLKTHFEFIEFYLKKEANINFEFKKYDLEYVYNYIYNKQIIESSYEHKRVGKDNLFYVYISFEITPTEFYFIFLLNKMFNSKIEIFYLESTKISFEVSREAGYCDYSDSEDTIIVEPEINTEIKNKIRAFLINNYNEEEHRKCFQKYCNFLIENCSLKDRFNL